MREPRPCGTRTAYKRHKQRGEPVDEACLEAFRRYEAVNTEARRILRERYRNEFDAFYAARGDRGASNYRQALSDLVAAHRPEYKRLVAEIRAETDPHARAPLEPCGTPAVYNRHGKRGETPCLACTQARSENVAVGYEARRRLRDKYRLELDAVYVAEGRGPKGYSKAFQALVAAYRLSTSGSSPRSGRRPVDHEAEREGTVGPLQHRL